MILQSMFCAARVDFEQYPRSESWPSTNRRGPSVASRPTRGDLLADIIPAPGKTKIEIASLLGISRQQLYDVIRGRKPVSPAVAARLGKLFGDGASVWLRMQAAHDAWQAEHDLAEELASIPTLTAA